MSPTSGKMTQLTQLIDSMKKLLIETKCGKIVQSNQKIIEIDASMSVSEGCRVLVDHQISSAPVVISNQTEDNRRLYIGMLDYRDIVEYCLAVFGKRFSPLSEEGEIRSADGGESCSSEFSCIEDVVRRASSGENVSIADITDISQRNPLISVSFDDPLQLAFDILSRRNGTHRLCVVREDGRVAAILSRTDLIRYFLNCSELQLILEQTVCETGIGLVYPKVTVKDSDRVLDALSCMSKEKISAVPVLSDNCIIGNISMADVKFIAKSCRWDRLWMRCARFISSTLCEESIASYGGRDRVPVFEVTKEATIKRVLETMQATHSHRVWIVEPKSILVGVISMTDFLVYLRTLIDR